MDDDYQRGPACPDCGSPATTIYPMEDGATLYCDSCKREELFDEPVGADEAPSVAPTAPDGATQERLIQGAS